MYCKHCGKECEAVPVDFGRGSTEAHGRVSHETNIQHVSDCCQDDITDDDGRDYEADEEADRGEALYERRKEW